MKAKLTRRNILAAAAPLAIAAMSGRAQAQANSTLDTIKSRGTIRVGWAIYFPNLFRDPKTNQLSGVMRDVMASFEAKRGIKVEWIEDNTATLIAGLQSDKFDLTVPMGMTEPRLKAATFTTPLLQEGLSLLAQKDQATKRTGWDGYNKKGMKISVTLGSNVDLAVTQTFKEAEIVRVRSESDSIGQVLSGQVDAAASGRSAIQLITSQRPSLSEVAGSTFQSSSLAPACRKGDVAFAEWFSVFGNEIKSSGELAEIMAKYGLDKSFVPA